MSTPELELASPDAAVWLPAGSYQHANAEAG